MANHPVCMVGEVVCECIIPLLTTDLINSQSILKPSPATLKTACVSAGTV